MKHFNGDRDSFMKGKNLLSYQMAIELTERFLKSEVKFLSEQTELVFIEALEQQGHICILAILRKWGLKI